MPKFRPGRSKPWYACVKVDDVEHGLGYCRTKWEAQLREQEFRNGTGEQHANI